MVDSFQDHVYITSRNPEPLIMYGLSIGHILSYPYMVVIMPRNAMLKAIGTHSLYGFTIRHISYD